MIRKYYNQILQTNWWQREKELRTINSHKTSDRKSQATSYLFLVKMIEKLLRNTKQKKDQTQNPNKQWEVHVIKTQRVFSLYGCYLTNAKYVRVQRSGIDTITQDTNGKVTNSQLDTTYESEPRGQPFPSRWPQGTY